MENILDFTADDARKNINKINNQELIKILTEIKSDSNENKSSKHYYSPLTDFTIESLKERGFTVTMSSDFRNGYFYIISW